MIADGSPTRTIAIESEDAAAVVAAVSLVGLADYVNTPYRRASPGCSPGRRRAMP